MNDLDLLKAELLRQDRALDECFEQMRELDPELAIAVSPEWMSEMTAEAAPIPMMTLGALRA